MTISKFLRSLLVVTCIAAAPAGADAATATFRYFRFTPLELRGPNPNSVQLSEVELVFENAPVAGAVATNPGGNNPTNEQPPRAVDGDTSTKWLDFNVLPLILDFGAPVTIDSYRFATANDAPERDPVAFVLEGSDDQANWTQLDVQSEFPTPTTRFTYTTDIVLPDLVPPFVETFSRDTPLIIRAGDSVELGWSTPRATSVTIEPGGLSFTEEVGDVNVTPTEDTTYTLTATNGAGVATATVDVRVVAAGGTATYQFYRFTPLRLRATPPSINPSVQVSEIVLKNMGTEITGAVATNPGGFNPAAEQAGGAVDGDTNTKWLDFRALPIILDYGSPVTVDSYTFATANDAIQRDPLTFGLEGSNDGTSWDPLSLVVGYPTPTARFTFIQDVPLDGGVPSPFIQEFVSDSPGFIDAQPVDLAWETWGAESVSIDQSVGVQPVVDGSVAVVPAGTTTYTLTASNAGGMVTAETITTEVFPEFDTIDYPNFDAAGDEIALLGAAFLTVDAPVANPGPIRRLRMTSNAGNAIGTAWFRIRQQIQSGFDTTFTPQTSFAHGDGGEFMAFMIQDTALGSGLLTTGFEHPNTDFGTYFDRLSIRLDSLQQGGDPSSAFIRVTNGTDVLATADLTQFPEITSLNQTQTDQSAMPPDITSVPTLSYAGGNGPFFTVRVTYVPNDLDVYFDGVLVIDSLAVDLDALGVVDENGTAFVGFSGRNTGTARENHDVTSWTFGPPVAGDFYVVEIIREFGFINLTWLSEDGADYQIERSVGFGVWERVAGVIPSAGTTTTGSVTDSGAAGEFFRIVRVDG